MQFTNSTAELEHFKTHINLVEYASSIGYSIDKNKSSRTNVVMRDTSNDKIIITQQPSDDHWVYWSGHDQKDRGTIIDFIQSRKRLTLGEVRKELRSWSGISITATHYQAPRQSIVDLPKVRAKYNSFRFIQEHPYLIARGIPCSTLNHAKFYHRIKIDDHNNVVFPHFSHGTLCGYDLKNHRFNGFPEGGKRGLWCSVWMDSSHTLVINESAIDALSYHAIHDTPDDFYVALGGQLGRENISLIRKIAQKAQISAIIIATDNDTAGDEFYTTIKDTLSDCAGAVTRATPKHKDWNEDLNIV